MKASKKKRGTQPEAPNNTKAKPIKQRKLVPYKQDTSRVRTPARTRARIARWRANFLDALARVPSVSVAAKSAGISRGVAYEHRERDEAFAAAWDDALAQSIDTLEGAAYFRAIKGDSQLMQFFLRAHKPERYRETLQVDQRLCGVLLLPEKELKEP
jgi:hypothetical protein